MVLWPTTEKRGPCWSPSRPGFFRLSKSKQSLYFVIFSRSLNSYKQFFFFQYQPSGVLNSTCSFFHFCSRIVYRFHPHSDYLTFELFRLFKIHTPMVVLFANTSLVLWSQTLKSPPTLKIWTVSGLTLLPSSTNSTLPLFGNFSPSP